MARKVDRGAQTSRNFLLYTVDGISGAAIGCTHVI